MNSSVLFVLALMPIVGLMIALGVLRIPAYKACTSTLAATMALALLIWKMPGLDMATAALEGAVIGLWPIMIVIVAAIFTYNLAVETKSMETIKTMLSNISTDRRIQVLILAWGFGGFLEAVAGYGTAVAIPASILASLGFDPLFAAVICLVANTVPTAFGAVGIPVTHACQSDRVECLDVKFSCFSAIGALYCHCSIYPGYDDDEKHQGNEGCFWDYIGIGSCFCLAANFCRQVSGRRITSPDWQSCEHGRDYLPGKATEQKQAGDGRKEKDQHSGRSSGMVAIYPDFYFCDFIESAFPGDS